MSEELKANTVVPSFFDRPQVQMVDIPIAGGIPFGFETISNSEIGIGGVYGTWGKSYANKDIPELVEQSFGSVLSDSDRMNLEPLGFVHRHHLTGISDLDHKKVETFVGSRLLQEAARASQRADAHAVGVHDCRGRSTGVRECDLRADVACRRDGLHVRLGECHQGSHSRPQQQERRGWELRAADRGGHDHGR